MKTYIEILNEGKSEATEEVKALINELQTKISKIFPKSYVRVYYTDVMGKSVNVTFTYSKEYFSNEPRNDSFYTGLGMGLDGDGNIPAKAEITISSGGTFKPDPYDTIGTKPAKLGWRNKKGSKDQIVKHVENYFKKIKKFIETNNIQQYEN